MMENLSRKEQAQKLAQGYNSSVRWFEYASILSNVILSTILLYRLHFFISDHPILTLALIIITWPLADLISGTVHWFADSWGTPEWPIVGNTFIRSFREHHVDPLSITRHDWIETNGANFFAGVPGLILCQFLVHQGDSFKTAILFFMGVNAWSVFTNQIHKWSHQAKRPQIVTLMQKGRIILSPENHAIHHRGKHDKHYCITSGVMNSLLLKIKFFEGLEKVMTLCTGQKPQHDDL